MRFWTLGVGVALAVLSAAPNALAQWVQVESGGNVGARHPLEQAGAMLFVVCEYGSFNVFFYAEEAEAKEWHVILSYADGTEDDSSAWEANSVWQADGDDRVAGYPGASMARDMANGRLVGLALKGQRGDAIGADGLDDISTVLDACGLPVEDPMGWHPRMVPRVVWQLDNFSSSSVGDLVAELRWMRYPMDDATGRDRNTYVQASLFWHEFWDRCRAGEALGPSCEVWLASGGERQHTVFEISKEARAIDFRTRLTPPAAEVAMPPRPTPTSVTSATDLAAPRWRVRPIATPDDYPMRAQNNEVQGSATVRCQVESDGRLTACEAISESPQGYGFADAAMRAARRGRVDTVSLENQPSGRTVTFRIDFRL